MIRRVIGDFVKIVEIEDKDNKINRFVLDGVDESEDHIVVRIREGDMKSRVRVRRRGDRDINMKETLRIFEL